MGDQAEGQVGRTIASAFSCDDRVTGADFLTRIKAVVRLPPTMAHGI